MKVNPPQRYIEIAEHHNHWQWMNYHGLHSRRWHNCYVARSFGKGIRKYQCTRTKAHQDRVSAFSFLSNDELPSTRNSPLPASETAGAGMFPKAPVNVCRLTLVFTGELEPVLGFDEEVVDKGGFIWESFRLRRTEPKPRICTHLSCTQRRSNCGGWRWLSGGDTDASWLKISTSGTRITRSRLLTSIHVKMGINTSWTYWTFNRVRSRVCGRSSLGTTDSHHDRICQPSDSGIGPRYNNCEYILRASSASYSRTWADMRNLVQNE